MYDRQLEPSEVIPTTGCSNSGSTTALAAPSTAPAAWLKDDLQIELRP